VKPPVDLFAPPPVVLPPRLPANAYRTHTGRMLDLADPEHADISIEDVAHHLARVCRFGGAVDGFYSVASHTLYVSRALETRGHSPYVVAAGLLHDSAEAYLGDVVSGLKRMMPDYKTLEKRWEARLQDFFDIRWRDGRVGLAVKDADLRARLSEVRDLFRENPYPRELLLGGEGDREPFAEPVVEHSPDEGEWLWLARARELGLW
jgi:5'-deoxynucleotidase YfbR-like HD superfamily hydrolase